MEKKQKNLINKSRQTQGLMSLSESMTPYVKRLLGQYALFEIDLLKNWNNIIGEDLAQYCFLQKIEFKKDERTDGILYVMTSSGAFALEIQHKSPVILEKINTYFGFCAVTKIKIFQNDSFFERNTAKFDDKPEKKLVSAEQQNYINQITEDIQNTELKTKLQKLGKSILGKKQ